MPKIQIKHYTVQIDRKRVPLISGEMHYWRLNPDCWATCLDQIRKMGLNMVSTYVPWDYHEYKRGHFDFDGQTSPARNLKAFLQLTRRKKFWLIIRPGPYIYSEWPNDGVPDYAHRYHRLHPAFRKHAVRYLTEVCKVIRPFQASRPSGHILLLQADNEIDPWPDQFGHQYGLGRQPGLFQEFIRKKYENNIQTLNQFWEANYRSFAEVGPYELCEIKGDRAIKRNLDYFEFKHDYSTQVAKWVIQAYRDLGITVPIYLNAYPFFYAHDWRMLQSVSDMVGIDLYPENEFSVNKQDHRKMMDKGRYLRSCSSVPYIAEFASGVWHNHHYATGVLTPNHYRLLTVSMLLAGIKGWNWYMLVNRDNWYMAPISEWGRPRQELFDVFKSIVKVFRRMDPPACEKIVNVSVAFNTMQYAAQTARQEEDVLTKLYEADIDYEFFDTQAKEIRKKILFYTGSQWLNRQKHRNLLEYVTEGGILVAFISYPRKDDNFEPYNPLGFRDPDRILFKFKKEMKISLTQRIHFKTVTTLCAFNHVEGRPIKTVLPEWGSQTIGYLRTVGKGKILHLAVEPKEEVLRAVLQLFDVQVPVSALTSGINTALFKRASRYYLPLVNNSDEAKGAVVQLNDKRFQRRHLQVKNLFTDEVRLQRPMAKPSISWQVPRKDGIVLEITVL